MTNSPALAAKRAFASVDVKVAYDERAMVGRFSNYVRELMHSILVEDKFVVHSATLGENGKDASCSVESTKRRIQSNNRLFYETAPQTIEALLKAAAPHDDFYPGNAHTGIDEIALKISYAGDDPEMFKESLKNALCHESFEDICRTTLQHAIDDHVERCRHHVETTLQSIGLNVE